MRATKAAKIDKSYEAIRAKALELVTSQAPAALGLPLMESEQEIGAVFSLSDAIGNLNACALSRLPRESIERNMEAVTARAAKVREVFAARGVKIATEHLARAQYLTRKHGEILLAVAAGKATAADVSASTLAVDGHWEAARAALRKFCGSSAPAAEKMARKIFWGSDVG